MTNWIEAIYQWVNDFSPLGILVTDDELIIRSWNHWLEIHSEHRAEELIGRPLLQVYPELISRGLDRYYREALAGQVRVLSQRLHRYLLPMPSPDSRYPDPMLQSAQIAPLWAQQRVIGTITVIEDVTERVARETALRASEERFRSLVQNSSDIIAILDAQAAITYISPSGERILGHPPEQLIGESALQFVHPQDLSAVSEALNQVRQRPGVITSIEFRFQHQDGTYHWLEATGNNLLDNPAIQGIVINARDVSQRKQAEEEREKLIGELQAALEQVRTLSGLLPICSSCKKIRDDAGYWHQVEEYIRDHSEVEFTHSLCPDCARKLFPEYYDDED